MSGFVLFNPSQVFSKSQFRFFVFRLSRAFRFLFGINQVFFGISASGSFLTTTPHTVLTLYFFWLAGKSPPHALGLRMNCQPSCCCQFGSPRKTQWSGNGCFCKASCSPLTENDHGHVWKYLRLQRLQITHFPTALKKQILIKCFVFSPVKKGL